MTGRRGRLGRWDVQALAGDGSGTQHPADGSRQGAGTVAAGQAGAQSANRRGAAQTQRSGGWDGLLAQECCVAGVVVRGGDVAGERRPGEPRAPRRAIASRRGGGAPRGRLTASTSAFASPSTSSGSTSQPVRPWSTMSAGPWASTAIAGSPQAIPSTSTWPNCSRTDGEHDDVGGGEDVRQLVVLVPAGQEHVLDAEAPDRVQRVLALPLAGEAADEHERRRRVEAGASPGRRPRSAPAARLTSVKRPM